MTEFTVTSNLNGLKLDKEKYRWDEEAKSFECQESNICVSFDNVDGVKFVLLGDKVKVSAGNGCTFYCRNNANLTIGDDCCVYAGSMCTFSSLVNCTFYVCDNCIFDCGDGCTFHVVTGCTFKTGNYCTFYTGDDCKFDTAKNTNCNFVVGNNCWTKIQKSI